MGLRRGQVWSYDLIIGSILFMIAMGILAFFWWSARTNISENKDAIVIESMTVSDSLMTPGTPTNWETLVNYSDPSTWGKVQQIGITQSWNANDSNVISYNKLYTLFLMSQANYQAVKSKLSPDYDFYIEMKFRGNGTEQMAQMNGMNLALGSMYNDYASYSIAKTERVVKYNGTVAIMKVYLWSDSPWQ